MAITSPLRTGLPSRSESSDTAVVMDQPFQPRTAQIEQTRRIRDRHAANIVEAIDHRSDDRHVARRTENAANHPAGDAVERREQLGIARADRQKKRAAGYHGPEGGAGHGYSFFIVSRGIKRAGYVVSSA